MQRRLAAILSADVVGYTRLMGKDEAGTLERLKSLYEELLQPRISERGGRIVKLMGDGLLAEFPSVVEAVQCAIHVQQALREREPDVSDDRRIQLRIGVNLGDLIGEGSDVYGDGVNIAARLQEISAPGGIALSGSAYEHASANVDASFEDDGEHNLKNVARPVRVYYWSDAAAGRPTDTAATRASPSPAKPTIAVLPFAAFEAAARHGGFAGAANELSLSRGAISSHVKLLEEHLGVTLFRRLPQGIVLTEQGRQLVPVLTDAFEKIRQGALNIASDRSDLRVICPPTVSIRWLIPKLGQFHAQHSDIRIRLTTEFFEWEDFLAGVFDLGFRLEGYAQRPTEIEVLPMFPMLVVPACAPALLDGPTALKRPEDLAKFTLLHEGPDRHDWTSWLKAFDVKGVDPQSGQVFANLDLAVRAAVMGLGIVMGDVVLTRDEFESGQLVMPFEDLRCVTDYGKFCLFGLSDRWHDPKVESFRSWVTEVAQKDVEALRL